MGGPGKIKLLWICLLCWQQRDDTDPVLVPCDKFTVQYVYRQTSNIRRTKSQKLNVSCLVLQLSLPNPLSQVLSQEWRLKMKLELRRQAIHQLHLSDQQFYCLLRCDLHWMFDGILIYTSLIQNGDYTRNDIFFKRQFSYIEKKYVILMEYYSMAS